MTREERDRAIAELRDYFAALVAWDGGHALPIRPKPEISLGALDALIASERQAKELLSTLVYWHDQPYDHIDESWWEAARELAGGYGG